ncbi:MAG: fatty acid desaturase [Lysobacterales bacterium]
MNPSADFIPASLLRQLCNAFAKPQWPRAVWQLVNTLPSFLLLWALMAKSIDWGYGYTLLLAIPTAGLYVRMFIIQHDCGHGSFLGSQRLNDLIGSFLGLLTLFPYGYWKKTHNLHHGTSGNLDRREIGDIDTLTVSEYQAKPWWQRLAYRLYRHPAVMLGLGPVWQFVIKHRLPFDLPLSFRREWRSVMTNNVLLLLVGGLIAYQIGWQTVLLVHLPIVLIAGAVGVWLFYCQHQFEGAYWRRDGEWDAADAAVRGSSYFDLPRWLHWFTGNIGYHHIHHLASRIPNYRLREAFESSPLLQIAPRLTLWTSLRCARLKLWDEEAGRLVGFPKRRRLAAT